MQTIRNSLGRLQNWHRLFLLVLVINIALIGYGIVLVPQLLPESWLSILAAVSMQILVGGLSLFGPWSLDRYKLLLKLVFIIGSLFAFSYTLVLLSEFTPSINLQFNVIILFLMAAMSAGIIASTKFRAGPKAVLISSVWTLVVGTAIWTMLWQLSNYLLWRSDAWYFFWQNEGTLQEFHRSGSHDLIVFIIQDIHGALFFHPLLCVVIGLICGGVVTGLSHIIRSLRRSSR